MPMLSGLNIVDVRLSVPIKVTEHVHLTPYIGGIFPLEALEDAALVPGTAAPLAQDTATDQAWA